MKKSNIVILVVIAVSIAVIIGMVGDFSTYETFATAAKRPGKEFHVIGQLDKTQPMVYDPAKNANYFTFYAKDKKGNIRQVVYHGTEPTDFQKSEQIVLTGSMGANNVFQCSQILMKCPSKYVPNQAQMNKEIESKM